MIGLCPPSLFRDDVNLEYHTFKSASQKVERKNNSIRVCLDYGEAYGNLGEEAMLMSAIDRLTNLLGECKYVIPVDWRQPLPKLPSNTILVSKPRIVLRVVGRIVRCLLRISAYLPVVGRPLRHEGAAFEVLVWKTACPVFCGLMRLLTWLPGPIAHSIHAIRTCDIFYSVGSGAFNDYNLPYFIYRSWLYRIVRPSTKVSVVSSHGLGPLNLAWAQAKTKECFSNVDILSFRDCCFSEAIIKNLGISLPKCHVVGDETFSLRFNLNEANALLSAIGIQNGESFIAFHFRATDCTKKMDFLYPKIAHIMDRICETVPHRLVFFPMSYHTWNDQECGQAIRKHMTKPGRLLLAPLSKNARAVKGAIGRAAYSLGLSYHVHVFALSQGKPAIVLYTGEFYRLKSTGLIDFYGEPCKAIDVETVDTEDIIKAVEELEQNYGEAIEKIAKVNCRIQQMNDWHLREMKAMLDHQQEDLP